MARFFRLIVSGKQFVLEKEWFSPVKFEAAVESKSTTKEQRNEGKSCKRITF
jgi:hypothetical protein